MAFAAEGDMERSDFTPDAAEVDASVDRQSHFSTTSGKMCPYFGCIAALDGNCGARALAEQLAVAFAASLVRLQTGVVESAERHRNLAGQLRNRIDCRHARGPNDGVKDH